MPVETVPSNEEPVHRPAIQQNFYDVEHKVIVRPVGTAVIELDQHNNDGQPQPDHSIPDQTAITDQDASVYYPESPTYVYQDDFAAQQPYGPIAPTYAYGQHPFAQYPPIYAQHYPQPGYPPVYGPHIPPPVYYPEQPPVQEDPTVVVPEPQPAYDHGVASTEQPKPPVSTTPLPCPPIDSELIEPHSPAEHPETTASSTTGN